MTFDSRHYICHGFKDGYWILERVGPPFSHCIRRPIYKVPSGKFVDAGEVYFLKEDGSVEDNHRNKLDANRVVRCDEKSD